MSFDLKQTLISTDTPEEATPVASDAPKDINFGLVGDEVARQPLKQFLGLEGSNTGEESKLDFLLGWAQKQGITDRADMLAALKKVELKLGSPTLGESRIGRLYHYLRLDSQLGSIIKELNAYEGKV